MVARLFETFEKNEVMKSVSTLSRSPWSWVPTLYLAEGIPYVAVMSIAVIMYDRMGISHTDIAFYTAWLYLPWVIKPLWSPFVDILRTRRWWIVAMQFLVGAAMAGVALTLPAPFFFRATLAFFWLMAFSSATHDIAADGFYMLALDTHQQSFFVGIRSTFYRIAMIAGQGLLVMLAGLFEVYTRVEVAWLLTFGIMALLFFVFAFYHLFLLPRPQADKASAVAAADIWRELGETFRSFFRKPGIGVALLFLLTYRLAEAQLVKMSSLFLLDARPDGGLALTTGQVGFVYGTVGVIALTVGGMAMGKRRVGQRRVAGVPHPRQRFAAAHGLAGRNKVFCIVAEIEVIDGVGGLPGVEPHADIISPFPGPVRMVGDNPRPGHGSPDVLRPAVLPEPGHPDHFAVHPFNIQPAVPGFSAAAGVAEPAVRVADTVAP